MKLFSFAVFVFIITSCASNTISFYVVDENRISFDTFSFYERGSTYIKPQQKSLDSLIENSISMELLNKGYKLRNNSDVYVSFNITMGSSSSTNVDNRNYQTYQRYSTPNYYPNYSTTTTDYKEGVLLIEVWSSEEKLMWQGSKSFKVRKSVDTQALLIQYAREITASFKSNL